MGGVFAHLGLELVQDMHRTRLKWHRLRRAMTDPEFGAEVMAEGFQLGASMELDLQVRRDGGFVVLHDDQLDRETTAQGRVADYEASDLMNVRYRTKGRSLILSEHLAEMLPIAHPDALLQFDLKNDLPEVGSRGVAHIADIFGLQTRSIIVSGACLHLIEALGVAMPDLKRGIDPTDRLIKLWQLLGLAAVEAALLRELREVNPNTVYLHWEMLVQMASEGLNLVALAQSEGVLVDAWTHCLATPAAGFSDGEWPAFAALMALRPDQITTDEAVATEAAWLVRTGG